ncbi:MAG: hypothetical protein IPL32_11210 [Chloracidobacterium sp.]|nr:hypothetical protein [Chloracidobacterium sp.]
MINISTIKRFASLTAAAAALVIISGSYSLVHAQRDPFQKPGFMKPKVQAPVKTGTGAAGTTAANYGAPGIESRIAYFKQIREAAAANGAPLPKVTSVLTLNEMAVTGIFKTPRGYAAMVEATPIKLSYTIYPGEKFFDGQLVAVEENRLVFRRVTKVGAGKFVATVENKALKEYSTKAQIQGTAPTESTSRPVETASNMPVENPAAKTGKSNGKDAKPSSNPFLSPLDEMNNQPAAPETDKAKKNTKKPAKVARNK